MKLANEIAKQVLKEVDGWKSTLPDGQWDNEDIGTVANIIAAKLGPVRVALHCGIEYLSSLATFTTDDQGEDWDAERDMHRLLLKQTLAMLAEEKHETGE